MCVYIIIYFFHLKVSLFQHQLEVQLTQ